MNIPGLFAFTRAFHTSPPTLSTFPARTVRVTRRARLKHQRKQIKLKAKLGDKYKVLKTLPPFRPEKKIDPEIRLNPFFASPKNKNPAKVDLLGNFFESLKKYEEKQSYFQHFFS
jgi:hypothetical protein